MGAAIARCMAGKERDGGQQQWNADCCTEEPAGMFAGWAGPGVEKADRRQDRQPGLGPEQPWRRSRHVACRTAQQQHGIGCGQHIGQYDR